MIYSSAFIFIISVSRLASQVWGSLAPRPPLLELLIGASFALFAAMDSRIASRLLTYRLSRLLAVQVIPKQNVLGEQFGQVQVCVVLAVGDF